MSINHSFVMLLALESSIYVNIFSSKMIEGRNLELKKTGTYQFSLNYRVIKVVVFSPHCLSTSLPRSHDKICNKTYHFLRILQLNFFI